MRRFVFALAVFTIACSPPAPAPEVAVAAPIEQADAPEADGGADGQGLQGPFDAQSANAKTVTGDLSFSNTTVSFMNGILLRTNRVSTLAAFDKMSATGSTFDDAAPGDDNRVVDLFAVQAQQLDDAQAGFCGSTAPTYVALVHDQPISTLSLIAFSSTQQPSDDAPAPTICGIYTYTDDTPSP